MAGTVRNAEVEIYCKDHSKRWISVNLLAERDDAGDILHVNGTTEDPQPANSQKDAFSFLPTLML